MRERWAIGAVADAKVAVFIPPRAINVAIGQTQYRPLRAAVHAHDRDYVTTAAATSAFQWELQLSWAVNHHSSDVVTVIDYQWSGELPKCISTPPPYYNTCIFIRGKNQYMRPPARQDMPPSSSSSLAIIALQKVSRRR
jgi:hypothetical protein